MLLAKALRQADHDYLSTICPDRDDGEFWTSNLLDSFEIQLSNMFGHHIDAHSFGHGVDKFPARMLATHGDQWRGFKRLVGNRSQLSCKIDSVRMYYMAEFYLKYCDYMLRQTKVGNALHRHLDAKLMSSEMRAGMQHTHTHTLILMYLVVHACTHTRTHEHMRMHARIAHNSYTCVCDIFNTIDTHAHNTDRTQSEGHRIHSTSAASPGR